MSTFLVKIEYPEETLRGYHLSAKINRFQEAWETMKKSRLIVKCPVLAHFTRGIGFSDQEVVQFLCTVSGRRIIDGSAALEL